MAESITEGPISATKAKDVAAPDQKAQNKKIWKNMLAEFGSFRQLAQSITKDIKKIAGIADDVKKTIGKIEDISHKAVSIYHTVKDITWDDLKRPGELVHTLENEVFANTDYILLQGIPGVRGDVDALVDGAQEFLEQPAGETYDAVLALKDEAMQLGVTSYDRIKSVCTSNMRTRMPSMPDIVELSNIQGYQVAQNLALYQTTKGQIQLQKAILAHAEQKAKDLESANGQMQQAVLEHIQAKNEYVSELSVTGIADNAIQTAGMHLLSEVKNKDSHVLQRRNVIKGARDIMGGLAQAGGAWNQ
jgi:hypothetical protein